MPSIAITGYGPLGSLTTPPLNESGGGPTTTTPGPTAAAGSSPYQVSQAAADLLGPNATGVANSLYSDPNVSPQNANQAVNSLFSAQGISALDQAQGQAQGAVVTGDEAEANSYLTASTVADQDARLARVSASLQQSQEDRKVYQALSGQTADIAGAGFGNSGSAMYLMADSAHQGALADQLIGTQGEITAGGYEQQSLAAQAEAAAANAGANQAAILGNEATQTAGDATTAALNSAMGLLATGTQISQQQENANTTPAVGSAPAVKVVQGDTGSASNPDISLGSKQTTAADNLSNAIESSGDPSQMDVTA